jgi:basic amino acid/polyamine antiporter, APA family
MPAPVTPAVAAPRELKRELKLLDATMIVMGSMIGSGIFIVSADITRWVGSGGFLLIAWLFSGILTIMAALSYGELAGMFPQAGGQYVYLREAYNPLTGFLFGWTQFMVIQPGSIAAVGVAFAKFTSVLIPALGESNVLCTVGGFNVNAAQVLAIVSIAFLTWVNTLGVREGKVVQDIFTIAKTAALLGLVVLGISIAVDPTIFARNLATFWTATKTTVLPGGALHVEQLMGLGLLTALGTGMVGSLFACDAWNNVTFTAAEVHNPRRNIGLSLLLGTGIVSVLYIFANVAYLKLLPVTGDPNGADAVARGIQFATNDRVGVAAASVLLGDAAALVMAVFIMISTFGCNNGMILAGARVYYAMAKDGLFFKNVGELNKHSVPGVALVFQGVWAAVLCLSGKYGDLLDYVIFATIAFYGVTIFGLFVLRRKRPELERPYKVFGYPVLPAIYIVIAAAFCVNLLINKPNYSWPGLIIVLLGVPVYYFWKKR